MKCIIKFIGDEDTTITIVGVISTQIKDHQILFVFLNDTIALDVYKSLPYYIKSNYKPSIMYDIIYMSLDIIEDLIIKQPEP